jgi:hypothetical protein
MMLLDFNFNYTPFYDVYLYTDSSPSILLCLSSNVIFKEGKRDVKYSKYPQLNVISNTNLLIYLTETKRPNLQKTSVNITLQFLLGYEAVEF